MMARKVVIVGAGQAGYQVAASLRAKKFDGAIVILGEEPALPYQRPPLSKGYVKGDAKESTLLLRAADFYPANSIDIRIDCRVAAIDRAAHEVALADGERVGYDSLVLATGGRVRKIPVPGAELAGVAYVRTLADAKALKPQIEAAKNVVVVGGGFIGLECASVASVLGCKVVVLEAMDRLMARVVSPVLSDYYRDLHRSRRAAELIAQAREEFRTQQFFGCLEKCELIATTFGDTPEAIEAGKMLADIRANPEWMARACNNLNERLGGMYLSLAESWLKKGKPDEAVVCLEKVQQVAPGSTNAQVAQSKIDTLRGKSTQSADFKKP